MDEKSNSKNSLTPTGLGQGIIYVPRGKMERVQSRIASSFFVRREGRRLETNQELITGKGIKVAILDTGIDTEHPALKPNIEKVEDFTGSPNGISDESAHGSLVAGVVAARRLDGEMEGVAPEARLYIGKVIRNHNGGGQSDDLIRGIRWAIKQGVQVINISLGCRNALANVRTELQEAKRLNIFVICAAGNHGRQGLDYPARYDECVAVGALDSLGGRWEDGEDSSAIGREMDVAAFGDRVISTWPGGGYGRKSGTSMAAPYVAGAVALALAKQRDQSVRAPIQTLTELLDRLARTAIDRVNSDEYVRREIDQGGFLNSI